MQFSLKTLRRFQNFWINSNPHTMTRSSYILGILLATLLSWGAWIVVINRLSPYSQDKNLAFLMFFASLFFAVSGTLTLLGYFLRIYLHRNEVFFSHIGTSLRQGVLLSIFMCICLVFQMYRVFTWWNAGLLLLSLGLIEVFFLSRNT